VNFSSNRKARFSIFGHFARARLDCGTGANRWHARSAYGENNGAAGVPSFAIGLKSITAETGEVLYELNSAQLFVPGSTTKLLTKGTLLKLLGGDYSASMRLAAAAMVEVQ
jgi:hypothetical protein